MKSERVVSMNRQQFNKTIETVINSPRNNLQMISVLQNAFALYVQEETDRIVEQLEEHSYIETVSDLDPYWDVQTKVVTLERAIEIAKAGGTV